MKLSLLELIIDKRWIFSPFYCEKSIFEVKFTETKKF